VDAAGVEALRPLRAFVGDWRGVGMPRRGSAQGAWQERAEWAYDFADKKTAVVFDAPQGRYFTAGRIEPGENPGEFVFIGTLPGEGETKRTERFLGAVDDAGDLVVDLPADATGGGDDRPTRITFRIVAQGDRLLVLLMRRVGDSDTFTRLAQIGYTREGSNFGGGGTARECVVTGGESSRTVEYKGKTYYVCCKGCADAFNEDPEGVLAEYRERKRKEAEEKGKG
jgi:YHS domain-containing protein